MSNLSIDSRITIVGAGMGGTLMAIYLARRGFQVDIYERRGDMRGEPVTSGRSINMTLAERGLHALREVGLLETVMQKTIPLRGRMVHDPGGLTTFQPYGKDDHEVIHSIMRNQLNIALMNAAEAHPNVKLHFNARCVGLDKTTGSLELRDENACQTIRKTSDFIIGADGVFSTIRQQIHKGERAHYQQEFLDWGYKEMTIPAGPNGSHLLHNNALHIWPRGRYMLMAMPNFDGSFTCTCILPFESEGSFASLTSEKEILNFFDSQFPDAVPLLPNLVQEFIENPVAEMITVRTSPWYYKDKVVLLGDSCHAVAPFYGQGMNAAFEDCSVLDSCLSRCEGQTEKTFAEYQRLRKPHTDVLAELSKTNFIELRDKLKSPMFVARKKLDVALNRVLPKRWVPLYTMISHTNMPYADAVERSRKQNRRARWLGIDIILLFIAAAMALGNLTKGLKPRKKRKGGMPVPFGHPLPVSLSRSNRER